MILPKVPTGTEARLIMQELLFFTVAFRFSNSVYTGVIVAFLFGLAVQTIRVQARIFFFLQFNLLETQQAVSSVVSQGPLACGVVWARRVDSKAMQRCT